jgi:hypothetical protein
MKQASEDVIEAAIRLPDAACSRLVAMPLQWKERRTRDTPTPLVKAPS